MKEENVVVWLTNYALTTGIKAVVATIHGNSMVSYKVEGEYPQFSHGNDWHRTPEDAIARAEQMRRAKIVSLEKSLVRVNKLVFTAPPKESAL